MSAEEKVEALKRTADFLFKVAFLKGNDAAMSVADSLLGLAISGFDPLASIDPTLFRYVNQRYRWEEIKYHYARTH